MKNRGTKLLTWLVLWPFARGFLGVTPWVFQHGASIRNHQQYMYRIESESSDYRLSHMMLKVESVDGAVAFWKEHFNATILESRRNDKSEYQSAFIALGNGTAVTQHSFALELISTTNKVELGNVLKYIGVSRLLQFQVGSRNLQELMTPSSSSSSSSSTLPPEPNGLPIQWATSSPGDFVCRVGLRTNDIDATIVFYKDLLNMQVAAADDSMLCLRYSAKDASGVPTTLVFEGTNEPLEHGTCLDHLVIRTRANIQDEYQRLQHTKVPIFMKPTFMFGSNIMGVKDPNGYRIILAEEVKNETE
jgi:catechol 2,3-dioxygenase-like lactoylglutathione lyase family enzyme